MLEGIFIDLHGSYSVTWRPSTVSCKPAGSPLISRYGGKQGVDGAAASSQRVQHQAQHQSLVQGSCPACSCLPPLKVCLCLTLSPWKSGTPPLLFSFLWTVLSHLFDFSYKVAWAQEAMLRDLWFLPRILDRVALDEEPEWGARPELGSSLESS